MVKRSLNPNSDSSEVAAQYEKWVYPLPVMDLAAPELSQGRDGGDFYSNFYTYWPDQQQREDLDILIAGCGSNAAARYAFNHPKARVVGIDLSSASLSHEKYLKEKHGLSNLTLHQGRLEDVSSIGKDFDFIDVSGVLHHLPDPVQGLKALRDVLRPQGTIAIMIYGQHGRAGVYLMQKLFQLMGLKQNEEGLADVKQMLAAIPKHHAVNGYMARATDIEYDAGLVDTFLHRQDRAYTVAECLDLVQQAGLSFMHWWDNILYYPEGQLFMNDPLYKKINALPEQSIWQGMELFNDTLGTHGFCVCHPSRSESSYKINFNNRSFMDYVPVLRCKEVSDEKATGGSIAIKRGRFPAYILSPIPAAILKQIDGKKTIRECYNQAGLEDKDNEADCKAVFQLLWRLSYIFLRIPRRQPSPV
jgi:SAM-dependent methyltransferase